MKKIMLFAVILPIIFSTGCWDRKDIESRAYILGVAIDKYPPFPDGEKDPKEEASLEEEKKLMEMQLHTGIPMYSMTIQLPIIKKATSAQAGTSGGGGGKGSKTWELTQAGNSLYEINREFATRLSQSPYYEHLQAIIISEDVAKNGISPIIDFFLRDPEMRRRTRIFISEEAAKKVLDVVPRIEDYSAIYLARLPMNSRVNARIIHKTDLGESVESIHSNQDFVIPVVKDTKDEIKTDSGAIFKGDAMVGKISSIELESVKFIRNLYIGGNITVQDPASKKGIITLEIIKSKTKIIPILDGGKISFKISIDARGNLAERVNAENEIRIDRAYLEQAEIAFAKQIETQCISTIKRVQKDCGADIFHFCDVLSTKKPAFWDMVKEQWHDIFPTVDVQVSSKVSIRQIGNTQ